MFSAFYYKILGGVRKILITTSILRWEKIALWDRNEKCGIYMMVCIKKKLDYFVRSNGPKRNPCVWLKMWVTHVCYVSSGGVGNITLVGTMGITRWVWEGLKPSRRWLFPPHRLRKLSKYVGEFWNSNINTYCWFYLHYHHKVGIWGGALSKRYKKGETRSTRGQGSLHMSIIRS